MVLLGSSVEISAVEGAREQGLEGRVVVAPIWLHGNDNRLKSKLIKKIKKN